ncbi:MAG: hypothetical protein KKD46_03090 [Euryarchaeota archaeon]|nr:hypothetical protein [Euryarchaeota archaeon]
MELLNMSKDIRYKDWKTISNWERTYKKKFLRGLSIDSAFAIFSELWDIQTSAKEIEIFRKRKIEELVALRSSFNLIQKRLHA